jgi:regulation of enolase protein 1 (concanavalin A-like superfamily)
MREAMTKDFWRHLAVGVATAAATAAVATLGHSDWSQLGIWAPAAQLAAQILTETYNQYVVK